MDEGADGAPEINVKDETASMLIFTHLQVDSYGHMGIRVHGRGARTGTYGKWINVTPVKTSEGCVPDKEEVSLSSSLKLLERTPEVLGSDDAYFPGAAQELTAEARKAQLRGRWPLSSVTVTEAARIVPPGSEHPKFPLHGFFYAATEKIPRSTHWSLTFSFEHEMDTESEKINAVDASLTTVASDKPDSEQDQTP